MAPHPVMVLVAERKLADFIDPPTPDGVLEASGVIAKGADYYVVFDNVRRIARIHRSLEPGSTKHSWFGRKREGDGYEDIAFSRYTHRFYLLIEAEKHPDGTYKALIDECDESANYKRRRWVDVAFEKRNTGFEGLSAVRWRGQDFLLALCEGNGCRAGRAGRTAWRRPHPPASTLRHHLEGHRSHQAATDRRVRRLLGGVAARASHRRALPAILEALDWHDSIRRLDDCRRREGVRASTNQEGQDQIQDPRRDLLADRPVVRVRLGPVEAAPSEDGPEDGPVDTRVHVAAATRNVETPSHAQGAGSLTGVALGP